MFARTLACIALLAAAGCTTLPAPPAPGAPPLTARPGVAPNFEVPDLRARMVYLARQEWALFGRGVVREDTAGLEFPEGAPHAHEVQPAMLTRVLLYWYAVSRQPIVGAQGELRPWSAAFISWLVQGAGVPASAFSPSVLHWNYIEAALDGSAATYFAAHDPRARAPVAGDLLCAPRGAGFVATIPDISAARRGPWHCDLVVEVRAGELDAIGGNVLDVVALTRVPLDTGGRALPLPRRPWRVLMTPRPALIGILQ